MDFKKKIPKKIGFSEYVISPLSTQNTKVKKTGLAIFATLTIFAPPIPPSHPFQFHRSQFANLCP